MSGAEPASPGVLLQLHELTNTWAPHAAVGQRPSCVSAPALSFPHPSLPGPSKLHSTVSPNVSSPGDPALDLGKIPTLNPKGPTPWVQPSAWTHRRGQPQQWSRTHLAHGGGGGLLTLLPDRRGEATPREGMLGLAQLQADSWFIRCSGGASEAEGHAAVRFIAHKAL